MKKFLIALLPVLLICSSARAEDAGKQIGASLTQVNRALSQMQGSARGALATVASEAQRKVTQTTIIAEIGDSVIGSGGSGGCKSMHDTVLKATGQGLIFAE